MHGRLADCRTRRRRIAQLERDFGAQLNGRLDEPAARGSFLLHAATLIMFEISLLVIAAQQLVIVRICRYCFVIQEIVFILRCTHTLERPGWLVHMEEVC